MPFQPAFLTTLIGSVPRQERQVCQKIAGIVEAPNATPGFSGGELCTICGHAFANAPGFGITPKETINQ